MLLAAALQQAGSWGWDGPLPALTSQSWSRCLDPLPAKGPSWLERDESVNFGAYLPWLAPATGGGAAGSTAGHPWQEGPQRLGVFRGTKSSCSCGRAGWAGTGQKWLHGCGLLQAGSGQGALQKPPLLPTETGVMGWQVPCWGKAKAVNCPWLSGWHFTCPLCTALPCWLS